MNIKFRIYSHLSQLHNTAFTLHCWGICRLSNVPCIRHRKRMSTCVLTRPMSPQHRQQGFGMCLPHPVALSNKFTLRDITGTAPLPSSSGRSLYIQTNVLYVYS